MPGLKIPSVLGVLLTLSSITGSLMVIIVKAEQECKLNSQWKVLVAERSAMLKSETLKAALEVFQQISG